MERQDGHINIDSGKAIDDKTVEIKFSAVSPWFFYLFRDQTQAPMEAAVAKEHATDDDPWAAQWVANNSPAPASTSIDSTGRREWR